MTVKRVTNLTDYLRENGVRYLTSEACALGLRSLYDVDKEVAPHLEDFFGMSFRAVARNNGEYSVLIAKDVLWSLCIFLAFVNGADEVYDYKDEFGENHHLRIHIDLTEEERERERKLMQYGEVRRYWPVAGQRHRNFASVHAAWGFSN